MFHVTDGDVALELLRAGGVEGSVIAWRDVLHEGPVPALPSLEALSRVRGHFIASCGWANAADVTEAFTSRDAQFRHAAAHDEVVLWFEADLYDQLQLLQILDCFGSETNYQGNISLVEIDGCFGRLKPDDVPDLVNSRTPISADAVAVAADIWTAFRSDTPEKLRDRVDGDLAAVPYLRDALQRHFQEYPWIGDGLTRSERQILSKLSDRPKTPAQLFRPCLEDEERQFLGDAVFLWLMRQLGAHDHALIEFMPRGGQITTGFAREAFDIPVRLTDLGRDVLARRLDWRHLCGRSLWRGGVELSCDNTWRFDPDAGRVVSVEFY